ncbi:hypothetical protein [Cyanobium usitatum]|uniref:hypothetical protein n=1 Tax=Cyanobium usitatum TaxID=2304190 RepID=UPI002AD40352|nr:hypothetical protein [Cyanobium usitatum]
MPSLPLRKRLPSLSFALGAPPSAKPAPWPGLPEEVEVHTRKRHGAWGRNGLVSQARARELWRQHRQKGWLPEA